MTGRIETSEDHAGLMARTLVMEDGSRWVEEHREELAAEYQASVRCGAMEQALTGQTAELFDLRERLRRSENSASSILAALHDTIASPDGTIPHSARPHYNSLMHAKARRRVANARGIGIPDEHMRESKEAVLLAEVESLTDQCGKLEAKLRMAREQLERKDSMRLAARTDDNQRCCQ